MIAPMMLLWAQGNAFSMGGPIVLVALFVLAVVFGSIYLGTRQARIERELEHKERMHALELGRTLPRDAPWWTPHRLAAAIGVGVPAASLLIALSATRIVGPHWMLAAWIPAGAIGVAGVIGGTVITALLLRADSTTTTHTAAINGKPALDPDALDVVGRRG